MFLLIHVLTKDFVVSTGLWTTRLRLKGGAGCGRCGILEKGRFAGYVGMKALLSIGAFIRRAIAAGRENRHSRAGGSSSFYRLPGGGGTAGIGWNALTLGLAIALGTATLAACLYAVLLITVPLTVFFPDIHVFLCSALSLVECHYEFEI